MLYLSDLVGKPVVGPDGDRVGRLVDLVASAHRPMPHPEIVAVVVRSSGGMIVVPVTVVATLSTLGVALSRPLPDISPHQASEQEVHLARDVLDKEIIDTNGVRVVRVNDVELARVYNHFYVANVDAGALALLRRLGLSGLAQRIASRLGGKLTSSVISWDNVELVPGSRPMRLRVAGDKVAELHPADIAEIISDLSRTESGRMVESLDVPKLADTLEEVEPDFQASLVQSLSDEKVADVLEEMAPDEAADLLAELPEDRSQGILSLMEDAEAHHIRKLLEYPEDTAGGLMNTEFVTVRPDLTAEQTLSLLREIAHEAETIYYVYVTDEENRLLGVFSLQSLVLAKPQTPVAEFMHRRVVSVHVLDSQDEVAQAISKYNLLAIPVVDDQQRLVGIVTADDALDKIIPTAWKKRLPRLFR